MTDAWAVRPGDRLGDFLIERLLGRGGFKSVYAARNLAAARNGWPAQVAVCIPHAQDAEARELLHNEIRVVRTLAHPGIVQEYGVEEVEGRLFTVMELVDGTPLNALLAERGLLHQILYDPPDLTPLEAATFDPRLARVLAKALAKDWQEETTTMSHFTRVQTVIRDQVVLEDTLRQLHYRFQTGERLPIRGYQSNTEYGQVVVDTGSRYDIGYQRQADHPVVCVSFGRMRWPTRAGQGVSCPAKHSGKRQHEDRWGWTTLGAGRGTGRSVGIARSAAVRRPAQCTVIPVGYRATEPTTRAAMSLSGARTCTTGATTVGDLRCAISRGQREARHESRPGCVAVVAGGTRGAYWDDFDPGGCRAASRSCYDSDRFERQGFRLVRAAS